MKFQDRFSGEGFQDGTKYKAIVDKELSRKNGSDQDSQNQVFAECSG